MLKKLVRKNKTIATIYCLIKGIYKIEICPICGHIYFGSNSICKHCNYEPLYDLDVEKYKQKYLEGKDDYR